MPANDAKQDEAPKEAGIPEAVANIWDTPDFILSVLAESANEANDANDGDPTVGIPVTLFVEGMLITGDLVGYKAYFTQVREIFRESNQNDSNDKWLNDFEKAIEDWRSKATVDARPTGILHLVDASVVFPGAHVPTNRKMPLRLRLSHVDGFMFGKLER